MCHNTANIDANIENMNAVASEMSEIQKNANAPLLDMLFKLAEHPQTDNLNPKRVKTLHEYAHKLLDFYMTECPDITSIRVINTTAVHDIATKLRTLSDGLARLLRYLGMNEDAAALTNLTSALANAYNMFGAAMAKAQHALDEFDDCDCDCDCDAEDNCEEDEEDEEDEEGEEDGDDAEEQARKLFERIFGFDPNVLRKSEDKAQPQPQPKPEEDQREKTRKEVEGLLACLFGCKPEAPKPAPEKATKPNAEDGSLEKLLASMLASEIATCRSPLMTIHGVHPGLWRLF